MKFKEWTRRQKCIVNRDCYGGIDPHHVRHKGVGLGLKPPDDRNLLPLCRKHHSALHTIGKRTFEKKFGLDLEMLTRIFWRIYEQQTKRFDAI